VSESCKFFTWNSLTRNCGIRDYSPNGMVNADSAGIVGAKALNFSMILTGVTYVGKALGINNGNSLDCQFSCQQNDDCQSWTWNAAGGFNSEVCVNNYGRTDRKLPVPASSKIVSGPKNCPPPGTILQNEEILRKGNLLTTVPFLTKEFKISFDVLISNFASQVQGILRFTSTGGNCCAVGDRLPGVWLSSNKKFYIRFALNGNGDSGYSGTIATSGEWINLEISQTLIANKYIFEIKINQKSVYHVENKQAKVFEQVKVFTAGPYSQALDGKIRKLVLETE